MRVFVAGATAAIGTQLLQRLVAAGHEVRGMTRSESKQAMLDELGVVPAVADWLDPDQVAEAVGRARPEVIVHELTAIGAIDPAHFDRDFAPTNRFEHDSAGVYTVLDDDPAPVAEWLPALAQILGAGPPLRAPRGAAGEWFAVQMNKLRGASNAKAKRKLGWQPRHPSWRRGLAAA
jgi:nucleoside-diphosphate-sugar epimerase